MQDDDNGHRLMLRIMIKSLPTLKKNIKKNLIIFPNNIISVIFSIWNKYNSKD